jgi:tRNA threonylcarbamoyladenosine biosynthesis protein TsaE
MFHDPDDSAQAMTLQLPDEVATLALGAALGLAISRRTIVHLCGDLGAGKTTLVRGLLRRLGHAGNVRSPTYTLVELYAISNLDFYHFDFYRFDQPEEYLDAGLDEYFAGDGICLVEWPERAAPYVPAPDLRITLLVADGGRTARLMALSQSGEQCLKNIDLSAMRSKPASA